MSNEYTKYKATIALSKLDKRAIYEMKGEKYISLEVYINSAVDDHGNIGAAKLNFKVDDAWERVKVGNVKPDMKKGENFVAASPKATAAWDDNDSIPF